MSDVAHALKFPAKLSQGRALPNLSFWALPTVGLSALSFSRSSKKDVAPIPNARHLQPSFQREEPKQFPEMFRECISFVFNTLLGMAKPEVLNEANLSKIVKRLELIKALISLEEENEIANHVEKLKQLGDSQQLLLIIELLDDEKWTMAIEQIDSYISIQSAVDFFIDPKVAAIKLEVKNLEHAVVSLRSEIAETERTINQFLLSHNQILGPIIIRILELKKERLKDFAQDPEGKAKWEEANREYEEYQNQVEDSASQELTQLTSELKAELKALYKKAALMCHPDKVSEELREVAEQIFKELNEANSKNDLNRVHEIYDDLLNQKFKSRSDTVNEFDQLMIVKASLQTKQKALFRELQQMKESETYQTITSIEDWQDYFERTQEELQTQLTDLLKQEVEK